MTCVWVVVLACAALSATPKAKLIVVNRATVVAFFPPVSDEEMKKDPGANESLADFQFYAAKLRPQLADKGIGFEEVYASSFDIQSGAKTIKVRPKEIEVGYYFVAPGKEPRVQYGVMTDIDVLEVAGEYFHQAPEALKLSGAAAANTVSSECNGDPDRRYAVCRGPWSGKTISLFNTWSTFDNNPGRRLELPSPDGEKVIRVHDVHVRLVMNGKKYWTPFGNMHDAEVGWAPDSSRLFVTWTETGELGAWRTQIYDVTPAGLREIVGVTRNVRPNLVMRMKKAPLPTWVNSSVARGYWSGLDYCAGDVVGSQWLNGSREILVSGMAGPDSGCKYMGDFVVYRIDVSTGRILQAYSQEQAVLLFGSENLPKILDESDEI